MNWIFLRGLTREQGHWGEALQVFESTNPDMKVFCLDLPGTGTERARNSPLSVSGIMEDLRSRFVLC